MEKLFKNNRREFLKTTGKAGLALGISFSAFPAIAKSFSGKTIEILENGTPFVQTALPYAFNALEPVIDARTMEIHYTKHAAGYASNLAEAVKEGNVDTKKTTLEEILAGISKYSTKMRNNAGGHYNHELFWKCMQAPVAGSKPENQLRKAIEKDFNSLEAFKTQFFEAAKNRFGSGWSWLIMTNDKKLLITSTPNQDNPLMDLSDVKGMPLLALDVWEHAYYLKYQNKRTDYINEWWNVVNWNFVEQRFSELM